MTYETTQVTISGYLVGQIWMPAAECWKNLDFDATDYESRCGEKLTLRDITLRATMDGDFQGCDIAEGVLSVTRTAPGGYRHTRQFPLDRFPSISDMVRTDWDGPTFDEEE